jgi:glutaredoxin-like protein
VIPIPEQNRLRERFSRELKSRVRIDYFTLKPTPIYVPGRECAHCEDVQTVLEELAALSPRISLTVHEFREDDPAARTLGADKVPGIVIRGQTNRPLRYFGTPSSHQFAVFIETLLDAARGVVELQPESVRTLRKLRADVSLRLLVTPACPYSPVMSRTAFRFGLQSVRVKVDVIEAGEFPAIVQQLGIPAVPLTVLNDQYATPGIVEEADLAEAVLLAAEGKEVRAVSRPGSVTPLVQAQPRTARQPSSSGLYIAR